MDDAIAQLITDITETMKRFAKGELVLPAAEKEYERLLAECETLEAELPGEASGIVRGILYYHNVRNCCLHSGVYVRKKGAVVPLVFAGDAAMAERVARAIAGERIDASEEVYRIDAEKAGFSAHVVYAKKISQAQQPLIFAALSSSVHFTEEVFGRAGDLLLLIFQGNICAVQQYSYFDEIRKSVDEYLDKHTGRNREVAVSIFIFRNIETIFSHMGMHTLLDVSKTIQKTLVDAFPPESLFVNPSFRMYVVFTPVLRGRGEEIKKQKVEFAYQGLALPMQRLTLPFNAESSRKRLWHDIFQFKDYILSGDCMG
jgi:hypothetical protein